MRAGELRMDEMRYIAVPNVMFLELRRETKSRYINCLGNLQKLAIEKCFATKGSLVIACQQTLLGLSADTNLSQSALSLSR